MVVFNNQNNLITEKNPLIFLKFECFCEIKLFFSYVTYIG